MLCGKRPEYVVFNELVTTTRHYARGITAIEASWLPELAPAFFSAKVVAAAAAGGPASSGGGGGVSAAAGGKLPSHSLPGDNARAMAAMNKGYLM